MSTTIRYRVIELGNGREKTWIATSDRAKAQEKFEFLKDSDAPIFLEAIETVSKNEAADKMKSDLKEIFKTGQLK